MRFSSSPAPLLSRSASGAINTRSRALVPAALLAAVLLAGCGKDKSDTRNQPSSDYKDDIAVTHPSKPGSPENPAQNPSALQDSVTLNSVPLRQALSKMLPTYLALQSALAADNLDSAKRAAEHLSGPVQALPKEGLDSLAVAGFNAEEKAMQEHAYNLEAAKDIKAMREGFKGFSDAYIRTLGKVGYAGDSRVFVIHCPMAFENKGADWLQSDPKVKNPYYGKEMLGCGEMVREIKPVTI